VVQVAAHQMILLLVQMAYLVKVMLAAAVLSIQLIKLAAVAVALELLV
jgi:hypothetical protein